MLTRTTLVGATLASLTACGGGPKPAGHVAPERPSSIAAPDTFVPMLTAVVFGNTFTRATADGAPNTARKSSGADQAVHVAAAAAGDERKRSCGNQGSQSHAQATAEFQPLSIVGAR